MIRFTTEMTRKVQVSETTFAAVRAICGKMCRWVILISAELFLANVV